MMRVAVSLGVAGRWMLMVAGGGWWIVRPGRPCTMSAVVCAPTGLMTGDWVRAAEMGATTVGSTAVEVVTAGRDCIDWWIICCTAVGCPGPALAPVAGLSTVGPLVLDMTAAAAAPLGRCDVKVCGAGGAAEPI